MYYTVVSYDRANERGHVVLCYCGYSSTVNINRIRAVVSFRVIANSRLRRAFPTASARTQRVVVFYRIALGPYVAGGFSSLRKTAPMLAVL